MKIERLELRAFGPFTDLTLDFSGDGLRIVYGPNEAGKSSTLRALRGLLFGIPERTEDNFLHENSRLRIGGLLRHSDGSELFCLRRKGRAKTILDRDEKEMDEALLRRFLGNVAPELFNRMFGLTHADLIQGGRDIIEGKGDLGESLFSAGLGGSGFRQLLQDLEAEAEELFAPRGSKKRINSLVNEHKEARNAVKDLALQGRDWEERQEALADALSRKEKASANLLSLRGERNRLERLHQALPLISGYKEALDQRQEMGEVLVLPPEFGAERKSLTERLSQGRSALEKARRQVAGIREELGAISLPEEILKHGETISRLHKRLGSHEKAMADLPGLRGEEAQLRSDAEAILRELSPETSFSEAGGLRLTEAERQEIIETGARLQRLEDALRGIRRNVAAITQRLRTVREDELIRKEPRDLMPLREAVRQASAEGDPEARLGQLLAELQAEEEQAGLDLRRIGLWSGSLDELESLPLPSAETIARFADEFGRVETALEKAGERTEKTRKEISGTEGRIAALHLEGDVPTEKDLNDARRHRERGWQLVRLAWLGGGATGLEVSAYAHGEPLERAFERSLTRADETADRLRREAERVARKATWLADLKRLEGEVIQLETEQKTLREKAEAISLEWDKLWEGMGIVPLSPKEMKAWLERQEALAERAGKIRINRTGISCLEEAIGRQRESLCGSISLLNESCKEATTLRSLLRTGQETLERLEREQSRRDDLLKRISEIEAELSAAQQEDQLVSKELAGIKESWEEALRPLGLDVSATPAVALALLGRNKELFVKLDQMTGLSRRIDCIVRDSDLFITEVRRFCSVVAPDMQKLPVEIAVAELHARQASAQSDSASRSQLLKQLDAAGKDLREAEEGVSETEGRLVEILRRAGCSTEEEAMEKENRSAEAVVLDAKISGLHGQLLGYASGRTVEALIAEADGVDSDSLPAEISGIGQRIGELEAEVSVLDQTIGSERREIERMDGSAAAAAAAERGQEVLAGLREEAEKYIRLRMASALLRSEMERYRAENQGPILRRASELFSALTIGSFSGLKTEYTDDDRPVLAGVRSDGRSVRVEGMSEGTSDQLYLALRLASLEKHLAVSEPLPFILDDILIHFDDERSKAVLQVLAQLSGRTQVILFTHHSHIVDLAGAVISPEALRVSTLQP